MDPFLEIEVHGLSQADDIDRAFEIFRESIFDPGFPK